MKIKLTILFVLIVGAAMGQAKKPRYYTCDVSFYSTDGCHHEYTGYAEWFHGSPTLEDEYRIFSNYIKPYEIIKGTFEITSLKKSSQVVYKSKRMQKFTPCQDIGYTLTASSPVSISLDTSHYSFAAPTYRPIYQYVFIGKNGQVLSVGYPDSTGTATIHLMRSHIQVVNDSTFTYKQQK